MQGDRFLLAFRQNQIYLNSYLNGVILSVETFCVLSKKNLNRVQCEPIAESLVVTFALFPSSPGVSLQANVLLRAGISCLGPASAAPRFNQALGSEIWAWRAGCTRAPFIWFQSSLRPRMWPRGHSFSRHWGVGRSGAEQHKGQEY